MFSPNKFKNNFALIIFAALCNACGVWQSAGNQNASPAAAAPLTADVQSEIPFLSREPDVYQTEIVVTAIGSEEKMFTARNGNYRRFDFNFSNNNFLISVVSDAAGNKRLINHQKKIYADDNLSAKSDAAAAPPVENWNDFLTADLLNRKKNVRFEKISTENNLTKYSIVSGETNAAGETIISIDENFGLPVKSEFYAVEGDAKVLKFSVEMKNIKLEIDDGAFQIPENFRKVSAEEFRLSMKNKNPNEK